MDAVIEVQNLERTFGKNRAVAGLTFSVARGEVFGLLGPNGAGKTTTVRLLNGILPSSGGQVRVFGLDPSTEGDQVRRSTSVLTENPSLYERLSARENLSFFGTLAEVSQESLSRRVDELLAFFELSDRADDHVETFSKGMKQRLALARALIHQPPLLFLDEPTAGLDPEAAQQVDALIETLSRGNGQTVVLCTHNLTQAQRLCDRVGIMNKGQFLAVGSLEDLAQQLWPVTWVDFQFRKAPEVELVNGLRPRPEVLQVQAEGKSLAVQLTSEEAIPALVRYLTEHDADILRVNPREYTLEALLYTPATDAELFTGKILAGVVPAVALSWLTYLVYGIVVNVIGYPLMGRIWFPLASWWPLMFWLTPAFSVLGISATVLVSSRVKTFMEAYQVSGSLVVLVLGLVAGQISGVLYLGFWTAVLIGLLVWLVDGVLLVISIGTFNRSRLIARIQ